MSSSIPSVVLLAQGDELTAGQTVDTNSAWLAQNLQRLGYQVKGIAICPHNPDSIRKALQRAAEQADLVVSTGGLGPTEDDYTAAAAAQWAGDELVLHSESLERIEQIWKSRNRIMPESNQKQAMVPSTCTVLTNRWGTAPGFFLDHNNTRAFFLPGVPREMRQFWSKHLEPLLCQNRSLQPRKRAVLRCIGISESQLQDRLKVLGLPEGVSIHYKTQLPENRIIIDAPGALDQVGFEQVAQRVWEQIGTSCLGIDTPPLPELLSELLRERQETLSTAESCTGGRISASMTALPGASELFLEGVCAYSNAAKIRSCQVSPHTLETHGAVSKEVALELASGIRARSGSTYGIGVTGIAGPGGGSEKKPIGTVHLALATPSESIHKRLDLGTMGRDRIITLSAGLALDLLRRHLQNPSLHTPAKI